MNKKAYYRYWFGETAEEYLARRKHTPHAILARIRRYPIALPLVLAGVLYPPFISLLYAGMIAAVIYLLASIPELLNARR